MQLEAIPRIVEAEAEVHRNQSFTQPWLRHIQKYSFESLFK